MDDVVLAGLAGAAATLVVGFLALAGSFLARQAEDRHRRANLKADVVFRLLNFLDEYYETDRRLQRVSDSDAQLSQEKSEITRLMLMARSQADSDLLLRRLARASARLEEDKAELVRLRELNSKARHEAVLLAHEADLWLSTIAANAFHLWIDHEDRRVIAIFSTVGKQEVRATRWPMPVRLCLVLGMKRFLEKQRRQLVARRAAKPDDRP